MRRFTVGKTRWHRMLLGLILAGAVVGGVVGQELVGSEEQLSTIGSYFMVLNLSDETVDVQLGEESVFSAQEISPGTPTVFKAVEPYKTHSLFFKPSSDAEWRYFQNSEGKPQGFRLLPLVNYVLLVQKDGAVELLTMARSQTNGSRIALLNAGSSTLDSLSLIDEFDTTLLKADGIGPQQLTEFGALTPGRYGAKWTEGEAFGLSSGELEGTLGMAELVDDGWYLLIAEEQALETESSVVLKFWDVSPAIDG